MGERYKRHSNGGPVVYGGLIMYQLPNITDDTKQRLTLVLPDGVNTATLELRYSSINKSWFLDLEYQTTEIKGRRVFASPNLLHQWKNILPFGLACYVLDGSEPYLADDFLSGRCGLLLLTQDEVARYTSLLGEAKSTA